ncbi:MAG: type I restriction endonuclease subunit R, partial [Acidobacteria bacterium]|nr:type I restriction endonuclease subunit R [Acidobacteriota bacterium]
MNEEQLENLVLSWFEELGYITKNGLDIAPDTPEAERTDYRQVILRDRLRTKLIETNPEITAVAIEDAIQQVTNLNSPSLLQNNREFHRLLRDGIKVEFQKDGETVGDFVRLFDFNNFEHNEFLAINQFSIKGAKHTKRPDIIVFINGLPIAVIELKNPADVKTNIVSSFHQLQTYKETIPDLFNTNEILVIADGREARAGSLTADIERPTIVVVTDRNDLDGQLFKTFSDAKELMRETPKQAETRQELRALLQDRPSGGVIFTTIQKFSPLEAEKDFPTLSERENIIVIADEAHRTQYGLKARIDQKSGEVKYGYAYYLRASLPNASFIAFTGTPVSATDRDTRGVFGDYIDIYDMKQSQDDGATVPIYYESRLAKLNLREEELPKIDAEADELTEDEEESAQARLKTKWAALEKIVGTDSHLKKIAADFVTHFEERLATMEGKAMIVCMSREICVRLHDEIIALRPEWNGSDPNKGNLKVIMTGSSSDKALLRPHIYSKQTKKDLEKRFKDAKDDFKIAIVRDMWLTGFDAPSLHTIYIDKPMHGHTLMQAIARVNRVFKDKPGGLVVDYIGIGHELKAALKEYTATGAKGELFSDVSERALPLLIQEISVVRGMFHGFDYQDFLTEALQLMPYAADHILEQMDGKSRLSKHVGNLTKQFALCCTLDEAMRYREEIAFFQAVKAYINKPTATQKQISDERREHALRQIVSRAVVSDEVLDIFHTVGLKKPNIGILSEEFLEEVRLMPQKNLAVELLERLLKMEIKTRFSENVVQYKK